MPILLITKRQLNMEPKKLFILLSIAWIFSGTSLWSQVAHHTESSYKANIMEVEDTMERIIIMGSLANIQTQYEQANDDDFRNHAFGEDFAKKMYLIEKSYTYITEPAPGAFSGHVMIEKPTIYQSISKINKYYIKGVRKGTIDKTEAEQKLEHVLGVAIVLCHQESSQIEQLLEKSNDVAEMILVFDNIQVQWN